MELREDPKDSTDSAPGETEREVWPESGCSVKPALGTGEEGDCSDRLEPDMMAWRRALPFGLRKRDWKAAFARA
jgi:hypothetical protein